MRRAGRIGFYAQAVVLNAVVALMFYVVTTPPPVLRASEVPVPVIHRPVAAITGTPNRIVIESIGIDLPVSVGTYDPTTDTWTLGDDQAFYADNSVPVNNNNGTTLIYGHARSTVFGPLPNLQAGTEAVVYTDNGRAFHYRYQSMKELDPTDTSVFTSSGPPQLTLQTCAGAWDMYRAMYTFQFINEVKV